MKPSFKTARRSGFQVLSSIGSSPFPAFSSFEKRIVFFCLVSRLIGKALVKERMNVVNNRAMTEVDRLNIVLGGVVLLMPSSIVVFV